MENKYLKDLKCELDDLIIKFRCVHYLYICDRNIVKFEEGDEGYEKHLENLRHLEKHLKGRSFKTSYNSVYTKSLQILKIVCPDRLEDFENMYKNKNRKANHDLDLSNYDIECALHGLSFGYDRKRDFNNQACSLLEAQTSILESVSDLLESKFYNIENQISYEIYMDELSTAEELLKPQKVKAFGVRPAGVIAGVALENHLKKVCLTHKIKITKKDTLSTYKEKLQKEDIIEVKDSKKIEFLSDIRNLVCHKKPKEPTLDDVKELIDGVRKILVNVT